MKIFNLIIFFCFTLNPKIKAQDSKLSTKKTETSVLEKISQGKVRINNASMKLQFFATTNAYFIGNKFDEGDIKFNRFRMEIRGNVGDIIKYRYRQSFNKKGTPYSIDKLSSSIELANMTIKSSSKFKFMIGKQYISYGGYEFYVPSLLVREFSEFNNYLTPYQAGVTAFWQINPSHELCFQIVNNKNRKDTELYERDLPEGIKKSKIPFLYSLNWNSSLLDKSLELRYSVSAGQQAQNKYAYYVTVGNMYKKGPLLAYFDIMFTRQEIDQLGIISSLPKLNQTALNTQYLSYIGNIDYRFNPKWNAYIKSAYETGRIFKTNGNFQKGMFRRSWNIQSSLEYYPFKNMDLFFFILYTYRGILLEKSAKNIGITDPDTQRISLGIIYSLPVF